MTKDSGALSIDFLVGFTIFLLAFIWVVSMIPGLLIGLQSYTIDYDAVAYRTGVILVEDPGEPALPLFSWESQNKNDVVRFGLAISKETPNILSQNKVEKFFCSTVFSYPDDYQQRAIFGDYPYQFNISLTEFGGNRTLSVGDALSGDYGTIRRLVKIKGSSSATINASNFTAGDNETTTHEFSVVINNTELLKDKVRDQIYQIDPARENLFINIINLNSTLGANETCFNITLTKIYAKDQSFVRIQLFPNPVIDGVPYHGLTTEALYTSTLPSVKNNISLQLDPNFIPWTNYPQVYLNLTFDLVKNTSAPLSCPAGSRFLNNSLKSAFDYNYNATNVKQPELLDGVLEVKTGSGYRTPTGPSPVPFVPNFKYEILSGAPTFKVQFTDLTTGLGVGGEWEWDFTNNGTVDSILNNPAYDYKDAGGAGIYFVNLTVKDASHPSVSVIKKVDLSKPIAGFSGTPLSGTSPLNVQFTDTSTGGAPSSWKWEYNKTVGGSWTPFNTTANPLNTFTNGTYDIRLTVTNIFGNSTWPILSYITAIPPPPVASFNTNPSPATGNTPFVVTFTDTSTGGTPDTWDWDFGDGTPHSNIQNPPAHTYAVAGSYIARLTVSNAGGSSSTTKPVSVHTVVIENFTAPGTTNWIAPAGVTSVEYLIVAGGGGGGRYGGGGGAGGFLTASGYTVIPGNSYVVTVGAGGTGGTSATLQGTSGSDSVFATFIAKGGGGGGGNSGTLTIRSGAAGGSGGGGVRSDGIGGSGTPGQGNAGRAGNTNGVNYLGGGGGGGVGTGSAATTTVAGNGGAGYSSSISGSSVTYTGGGGGGCQVSYTRGTGGAGGGGNGGDGAAGSNGQANTGGGGGGGGRSGAGTNFDGGSGGSGIVIIKYTI